MNNSDSNLMANALNRTIELLETENKLPPPTDTKEYLRALSVIPWSDIPNFTGEDKISQVVEAVLSPDSPNRFTVVESGNGVGKSLTAAAITCNWLHRYEEGVVITLAPTHAQVNNVLWRYIRMMHQKAEGTLPGEVFQTPRWDVSPRRYAVGLSPRRSSSEDLQALHGYHSPHLLVILDEAPGLPRVLWEAVQRLVTAEGNRVLALGNPIQQAGPFWEACQNREVWNYVHMSCFDHPNVQLGKDILEGATGRGWVRERLKDHCTPAGKGDIGAFEFEGEWYFPDGVFQSMVMGKAPSEATDQLIPLNWVMGAQSWIAEPAQDETIVLGLDPSRAAHGDASAMVCRKGGLVMWIKRRRMSSQNPTDEAAGWLLDEYRATGAGRVFVEETGIGAGIVDKARSLGIPVMAVSPGSGAGKRNLANKRAECWWRMREQLQTGSMSLPQDDMLAADLTTPKFHYDGQGRTLLESKEKIRERLGRSPDSGDALALTFALPERAKMGDDGRNVQAGLQAPSTWNIIKSPDEIEQGGTKPERVEVGEASARGSRWHIGGRRDGVRRRAGGRW